MRYTSLLKEKDIGYKLSAFFPSLTPCRVDINNTAVRFPI